MLIFAVCSGFSRAWTSPESRGAQPCARRRPGLAKRGPIGRGHVLIGYLLHRPEQRLDDTSIILGRQFVHSCHNPPAGRAK